MKLNRFFHLLFNQLTMSQKGSSIVSGDNPEVKYKKALMEIQKIHNANKVLKSQSEQMKADYERQLHESEEMIHHLREQNDVIKNEKAELEKFLDELQVSNTELRKQYNNLEREVTYLNDVLTEQNTQLKKVNAFKDQKGLTTLITSYQDREITFRKDIARQEELLRSLRASCDSLDNDLAEERRQRYKADDLNNALRIELAKYRELNAGLIAKNEAVVTGLMTRFSEGKDKFREAETFVAQIAKQLELLRTTRVEQHSLQRTTVSLQSYEALLQEKGKIQSEFQRLRGRLEQSEARAQEGFVAEQRMKQAALKAERLQEQCNMLKSKLIVVETKDLMQGGQDGEFKQFQERVLINLGQNDPLPAIKNSSDSSHFQLMKGYLVELKEKLSRALQDRKDYEKKYRSLKEKVGEKAEKAIALEQQNKLLRGKLQGFERLVERLQFQLQRNIELHDEEVAQVKQMSNTVLTKKAEETKAANAFIRAQLDLELDKFERAERGLRQEVETLKLELSTEKIKCSDLAQKLQQTGEFLNIYKNKAEQAQTQMTQAQQANAAATENSERFQELYREQRAKNQALLLQKQALSNQLSQVSEAEGRRTLAQAELEVRQATLQTEIRKLKGQLTQARNQKSQLQGQLNSILREAEDKARLSSSRSNADSTYYASLQQNYQQQREKNRVLQSQLATLKLRSERANIQSQKAASLQDALSAKADEVNDIRRKTITFQKQVGVLQSEMKQIRNEYDGLKRQNATQKAKLLENGQDIRRTYETKQAESKRQLQRLNEDLATISSELREEKRNGARWQTELNNLKGQLRRYQESIEQAKRREGLVTDELSQLRSAYENTSDQNERLKSQVKYKTTIQEGLNAEINGTQDRIYKLTQQNTENRLKLQAIDNNYSDLRRELSGLKIYINQIEQYANGRSYGNSTWQEQRDKQNLANFVQRLKKVLRNSELAQTTTISTDYRATETFTTTNNFAPLYTSTTPLPDYLKNYQSNPSNFPRYDRSEQSSPFKLNYDVEGSYRY